MAVQGGGGGKKIPPGPPGAPGPPRPVTNPKAMAETTGPQKPVSAERPATATATAEAPMAKELRSADDGFDSFKSVNSDIHRGLASEATLDGAFAHAASTPSGIENLVRVIDAARTQLAGENRTLRGNAQSVLERLVASGFAPAQLEKAKQELAELRKRMAALRKRLKHLQRRLKTTFATAGKTGDAQLAKTLGAQLQRLQKLEPGMSRALMALQTIEQAYATFADGSTPVLRMHVGDGGGSEKLGRALAQLAPGAAIARVTLGLLRDGPSSVALPSPALDDDGDARLDGPRSLVRALLPTPTPTPTPPATPTPTPTGEPDGNEPGGSG